MESYTPEKQNIKIIDFTPKLPKKTEHFNQYYGMSLHHIDPTYNKKTSQKNVRIVDFSRTKEYNCKKDKIRL